MIRIKEYIINKDKVLYIKRYGFNEIRVCFESGYILSITSCSEKEIDGILYTLEKGE